MRVDCVWTRYAENEFVCRRVQMLSYFAERFDAALCKGTCDNCATRRTTECESRDVSELGRSALELLGAARCQLTLTMLVDALKGSETKAMRQKGLPELPGFKGGARYKKVEVERILKLMIVQGYVHELLVANENFGGINAYLQLGPNAAALRQGRSPLLAPFATREVPETSGLEIEGGEGVGADAGAGESGAALGGGGGVDELLFDELRTLRKSLAEKGQAVFTIWPDKVQKEIVNVLPFSDSQLKAIHGIGKNKAERFGPAILGLIRAFVQRHPELLPRARANMEAAEKEEHEKREKRERAEASAARAAAAAPPGKRLKIAPEPDDDDDPDFALPPSQRPPPAPRPRHRLARSDRPATRARHLCGRR